jgi:hypothetical protein
MISLDVAELTVHETIGGEPEYQQKMLELYEQFFPEYAYYLPYMAYRMSVGIDADPGFIERWWLVEIDGELAGLRLFKYSARRNCGLVLGTAIKPKFRRHSVDGHDRLSNYLIDKSTTQIIADARAAGRPVPLGVVSEFQLPDASMTAEEAAYHQHIIDRYREIGCVQLPVDYYEPPHIAGRESYLQGVALAEMPYNHMMLSILPIEGGGFDIHNRQTTTDFALAFLTDHYKLPEDHWVVRRALESIDRYYGNADHD